MLGFDDKHLRTLSSAVAVALLLLISGITSFPQEKQFKALFPILQDKKWGFIDAKGQMVVAPQFDRARDFSEGLAPVCMGKKWGFIDEAGKWVVEPIYELALPFSEGLAQVRIGGQWTAEPIYLMGGQTSYIDKTGKTVFTLSSSPLGTSYDDYTFSEGLLPLALGNEKYGYLDKSGRQAIAPKFDFAGEFSEGLAGVWAGDYIGFIDQTGIFVINPTFPIAGWGHPHSFSEGLVSIPMGGGMGYIDKTGKVVIAPQFYDADSFSEGFAAVRLTEKENLEGYIDGTGKIVINPQFDIGGAGHFHEGLAAVRIDDEWGYIDKTGKVVIKPQFQDVHYFSNGLAQVWMDRKLGYINKAGEFVWKPSN
jgi:hypothetical protein